MHDKNGQLKCQGVILNCFDKQTKKYEIVGKKTFSSSDKNAYTLIKAEFDKQALLDQENVDPSVGYTEVKTEQPVKECSLTVISQCDYKGHKKSDDWAENTRYNIVGFSAYPLGSDRYYVVETDDGNLWQANRFLNDIVAKRVGINMKQFTVETTTKRWYPRVKKQKYLHMTVVESQ